MRDYNNENKGDPNYLQDLEDAVILTKALYDDAQQSYIDDKIKVSSPDWEDRVDRINLTRLNWLTAKSRIKGLDKESPVVSSQKANLQYFR